MKYDVAVLGAGSFGTAVANVLADAGKSVVLWGRDPEAIRSIEEQHANQKYLPNLPLNPSLRATEDLDRSIESASILVCAIPTQQIRKVFGPIQKKLKGKTLLNVSKGIELKTLARVEEIFNELAPQCDYVTLSGPSFAFEVVKRLPTAVTVASRNPAHAKKIQDMLAVPYFRAYWNEDVTGVELAGALKNVIAIASGVVAGTQLGYNAQAAIINRGMAEIARLGKVKGAHPMTFLGLAGMGDLVLTCTAPLSRNRKLGIKIGEGRSFEEAVKELGGVAEGADTAKSALALAKKLHIALPITEQVNHLLYEQATPMQALMELMSREPKGE